MQKRDVRLRREYLYRKSLEAKEQALSENKKKLKAAIAAGKSIPTELRKDEKRLRHEVELEDANTALVATHEDDEYARAGEVDPKVVVTTSHDPSSRLKMFLKEVRLLVPNAERVNRGSYTTKEIVQACKKNEVHHLVLPQRKSVTFKAGYRPRHPSRTPRRSRRSHRLPPAARPHRVLRPQQRGHAARHPDKGDNSGGVRCALPSLSVIFCNIQRSYPHLIFDNM
jgi:hypothetical protein